MYLEYSPASILFLMSRRQIGLSITSGWEVGGRKEAKVSELVRGCGTAGRERERLHGREEEGVKARRIAENARRVSVP